MTKEEYEALEDKWQTVYIDGCMPIKMVSKVPKCSSEKDHILWYDKDECAHTVHYSKVELERIDRTEELTKFAKGLMIGDYYYDHLNAVYRRVTLNTFRTIKVGNGGNLHMETEPIMLTKDMLEKNGFHIENGVAAKYWGGTDDGVLFDYMVSCDFCMDGVVKYVHIRAPHIGIGMPLDKGNEFRHALRLAGLYEMADKFEL